MRQQYQKLKKQYPDCILFWRLGDFYEAFDDDAKTISKVLGITLTGRGKDENRIPMAGIPHHALKQYLPKLVKAGYKVALGEQMEEATAGKLVERDVVKVITAGTLIDENLLNQSENNFLVSVYLLKSKGKEIWGLSYSDVSTGEFKVVEFMGRGGGEMPTKLLKILRKFLMHWVGAVLKKPTRKLKTFTNHQIII